jgi:hypothetical protein
LFSRVAVGVIILLIFIFGLSHFMITKSSCALIYLLRVFLNDLIIIFPLWLGWCLQLLPLHIRRRIWYCLKWMLIMCGSLFVYLHWNIWWVAWMFGVGFAYVCFSTEWMTNCRWYLRNWIILSLCLHQFLFFSN